MFNFLALEANEFILEQNWLLKETEHKLLFCVKYSKRNLS